MNMQRDLKAKESLHMSVSCGSLTIFIEIFECFCVCLFVHGLKCFIKLIVPRSSAITLVYVGVWTCRVTYSRQFSLLKHHQIVRLRCAGQLFLSHLPKKCVNCTVLRANFWRKAEVTVRLYLSVLSTRYAALVSELDSEKLDLSTYHLSLLSVC